MLMHSEQVRYPLLATTMAFVSLWSELVDVQDIEPRSCGSS